MTIKKTGSGMRFSYSTAPEQSSHSINPGSSCRIAIFGDFSGRRNGTKNSFGEPASMPHMLAVDHDNFNHIMGQLNVSIEVCIEKISNQKIKLKFLTLDDFHPDQIYEDLIIFQELRQLREHLQSPKTYEAAAKELRNWVLETPDTEISTIPKKIEESSKEKENNAGHETLEDLLTKPIISPKDSSLQETTVNLDSLLQSIVAPYVTQTPDPNQPRLIAMVDQVISDQMRLILNDPSFKELEAAWRGIHFLLSRLEVDQNLKLYLIDISKEELMKDLHSFDDIKKSSIYKHVVEYGGQMEGSSPFSLLMGCYSFDGSSKDITFLSHLAKIAKDTKAPFLLGIDSKVIGCRSLLETQDPDKWDLPSIEDEVAWNLLRSSGSAPFVGLVFPRILLRNPYGKNSDPIENFEFEEILENSSYTNFLWGNAAYGCIYVLAEAYTHQIWNFGVANRFEIENLPVHFYKKYGDSEMMPCAEGWLSDRGAEKIRSMGFIPVQSVKNRDAVVLNQLNSISLKGELLRGKWTKDQT